MHRRHRPHVFGTHRALLATGDSAQRDAHQIAALRAAGCVDLQTDELETKVGHQTGWRLVLVVQQVLLHPRLVDDDVREVRQTIFGVLHPTGAGDFCAVLRRWAPEGRLVDPRGLAHGLDAHAEGFKHFDRATGDAVRLAQLQWADAFGVPLAADARRCDVGTVALD